MRPILLVQEPRIPRSCDPDWGFRNENGYLTEEWYKSGLWLKYPTLSSIELNLPIEFCEICHINEPVGITFGASMCRKCSDKYTNLDFIGYLDKLPKVIKLEDISPEDTDIPDQTDGDAGPLTTI